MSLGAHNTGASGLALAMLGAFSVSAGCEKTAGELPHSGSGKPHIVVTQSKVSFRDAYASCGAVLDHLNTALFTYYPAYMPVAGVYATRVFASCQSDQWPDALKQCIVESTPQALMDHACDSLVSDELANKIIARVAPGQLRPEDLLRR